MKKVYVVYHDFYEDEWIESIWVSPDDARKQCDKKNTEVLNRCKISYEKTGRPFNYTLDDFNDFVVQEWEVR